VHNTLTSDVDRAHSCNLFKKLYSLTSEVELIYSVGAYVTTLL